MDFFGSYFVIGWLLGVYMQNDVSLNRDLRHVTCFLLLVFLFGLSCFLDLFLFLVLVKVQTLIFVLFTFMVGTS